MRREYVVCQLVSKKCILKMLPIVVFHLHKYKYEHNVPSKIFPSIIFLGTPHAPHLVLYTLSREKSLVRLEPLKQCTIYQVVNVVCIFFIQEQMVWMKIAWWFNLCYLHLKCILCIKYTAFLQLCFHARTKIHLPNLVSHNMISIYNVLWTSY
jgi:hypothetical protein